MALPSALHPRPLGSVSMTLDTNNCRYGRGWGRQQERAGTLGAPTRSYGAQRHLPLLNKGDQVSRQCPPKRPPTQRSPHSWTSTAHNVTERLRDLDLLRKLARILIHKSKGSTDPPQTSALLACLCFLSVFIFVKARREAGV